MNLSRTLRVVAAITLLITGFLSAPLSSTVNAQTDNSFSTSVFWDTRGSLVLITDKDAVWYRWNEPVSGQVTDLRGGTIVRDGKYDYVKWSADGGRIAISSAQLQVLYVFTYDERQIQFDPLVSMPLPKADSLSTLSTFDWSPDGKQIVGGVSGSVPKLFIWDAVTGDIQRAWAGPSFTNVAWRPNTSQFALSAYTGILLIDSTTDFTGIEFDQLRLESIDDPGRYQAITVIRWSPDGARLGISTQFSELRVFDAVQKVPTLELSPDKIHTREVLIDDLLWSPTGEQIASSSLDGTIKVWDATTGEVLASYQREPTVFPAHPMSWSPTGARLAYVGTPPADAGYLVTLLDTIHIVVPVATSAQLDNVIAQCTTDPVITEAIRALGRAATVAPDALDKFGLSTVCRDDLNALLSELEISPSSAGG